MVGVREICVLMRNPATIYPRTTGCFNHLNKMVMTPPDMSISAKSASIDGIFSIMLSSSYGGVYECFLNPMVLSAFVKLANFIIHLMQIYSFFHI